jgi:hypothetical protein
LIFLFRDIEKITPLDTEMAKLLEKLVVTGDQSPKEGGGVGTEYLIPIIEKDPRLWVQVGT